MELESGTRSILRAKNKPIHELLILDAKTCFQEYELGGRGCEEKLERSLEHSDESGSIRQSPPPRDPRISRDREKPTTFLQLPLLYSRPSRLESLILSCVHVSAKFASNE